MSLVRAVGFFVGFATFGGVGSCADGVPGGGFTLGGQGLGSTSGAPGTTGGSDAAAPADAAASEGAASAQDAATPEEAASTQDAASYADVATVDAASSVDDGGIFYIPPPADAAVGSAPEAGTGPVSTTDAAAVDAVPTIGGCQVFPADNPWNTRVDDPTAYPVDPSSATYLANMSPSTHLHADWGDWSTDHYGIPWQTVPGSQPLVPMTFSDASESDPGPYPFPPNALVEGGANSGGDMHVLVLDTGTCTLFETYDSVYTNPGWSCGSGAKFDLTSNALRPDGWTSADAAGLPILPGLVRVAEVQAGAINHALRFTVSNTQNGYIHPATHAAGVNNASLPPMGLRVRLKASFDLSSFTGPAKVILTAMQQYGMLLADNGSNWFVTGDSDDAWTPLMDGISDAFASVTGGDFEAVQTGTIQAQ